MLGSRASSLSSIALASLLVACGGSSSGGGGDVPGDSVAELRAQLAAAGIRPLPAPPPVSDELFVLGQALFFDKILSGNQDVSCATCHVPDFATGDGRTLSSGVGGTGVGPFRGGGTTIPRNSPALFALHLRRALFWDGRAAEDAGEVVSPVSAALTPAMRAVFAPGLELLATQAMMPPEARDEMRGSPGENEIADLGDDLPAVWAALLERLLDIPLYVQMLRAAYPGVAVQDFSFAHAANAIAAFEVRAFHRVDSPFERFVRGDDAALAPEHVTGGNSFLGPAGCARCHSGPMFTDERHHNIGLPQLGPGMGDGPCGREDFGREHVTGASLDRYAFRTPTLRNAGATAPFGHAGQIMDLRTFVSHYADVELSHLNYDIQSNVFDPELVTTLVPNSDAVLSTRDPLLQAPNAFDVESVYLFVLALTADDAYSLQDIVPASVPSGLPLD